MPVTNVSAGKPKVTGAIYVAATGSTLPTDATTALDAAFKSLGYISEDGLVNSNSMETTNIKAWGGDTVLTVQESKEDTFQFTMIEVLDTQVLGTVYNTANVSGTLATGITVTANSKEATARSWVIELAMREGAAKRIVIPSGTISNIEDINYTDSDAVGYGVTVTATPDTSGNTHYEYIIRT